ncbi:hypothetical protein ACJX0J_035561 [Zea mays]
MHIAEKELINAFTTEGDYSFSHIYIQLLMIGIVNFLIVLAPAQEIGTQESSPVQKIQRLGLRRVETGGPNLIPCMRNIAAAAARTIIIIILLLTYSLFMDRALDSGHRNEILITHILPVAILHVTCPPYLHLILCIEAHIPAKVDGQSACWTVRIY